MFVIHCEKSLILQVYYFLMLSNLKAKGSVSRVYLVTTGFFLFVGGIFNLLIFKNVKKIAYLTRLCATI